MMPTELVLARSGSGCLKCPVMAASWMVLLLLSVVASSACPDGYFSHSTSCYDIPKQEATWPEAKVYCQAVGADLAIVETQSEHNMLAAHLKTNQAAYGTARFWLDGVDYLEEGEWVWARIRQLIQQTFWATTQPDNAYAGQQQEHCLTMAQDMNYNWADLPCEFKHNFICELPNENVAVVG